MQTLREFRDSKGMSQRELADHLGCSQPTIQKYETGETMPTIDIIPRFAKAFGIARSEALNILLSDPVALAARNAGVSREVAQAILDDVNAERHRMNEATRASILARFDR